LQQIDLFGETTALIPVTPPPSFEDFWAACPRKVAKPYAKEVFDRTLKKHKVSPTVLVEAMKAYAEVMVGKPPKYVLHPSTWLNKGRWTDDLDFERRAANEQGTTAGEQRGDDRQARLGRYFANARSLSPD
jgi:hypothetical protein